MPKRLTIEDFTIKASLVHNHKYSYEKAIYINNKTNIIIICPTHGEFKQSPNRHLLGQGCKKCGHQKTIQKAKENNTIPSEQFFSEVTRTHKGKYTYVKTDFIDIVTKISIICPDHGEFKQRPSSHKKGAGCPTCGQTKANEKNALTKEEFIQKAEAVHGNSYSYENTKYTRIKDKLTIECLTHGKFKQTGYHHLRGSGCPKCAKSGFNPSKPAILYYLKINDGQAYKIGITNRSIQERFSLTDLTKIEVLLNQQIPIGSEAQELERLLIKNNTTKKYIGKNLLDSGNTELFSSCILQELEDELYKRGYLDEI